MLRNAVLAIAVVAGSLLWTSPAKAAAADPALSTKWVAYGQQLYAQRQYDKAIQAFSTAARANSGNSAAWKGLGNALYAKRDYANAVKYYKYALQLNRSDAQLAQFVQRLESSIAQNKQGANDPMGLAGRYYQARQYDYAIQQYNLATQQNPNNAKAYQGLGNCYYAKGNKEQAVAAYKRALQIDPSNAGLKSFLARYSPADAQASGVQIAEGPKDWAQPLWRSAILPGWGQFYNHEPVKGWIIGGLSIATLGATIVTYSIGDSARKAYEGYGPGTPASSFDSSYSTWESMAGINNTLAITFLALYSFNLVDAVISAKPATHAVGLLPGEEPPVQLGMLDNGLIGAKVQLLTF
jgi:tetratricopeptide (TPR) repeat protein